MTRSLRPQTAPRPVQDLATLRATLAAAQAETLRRAQAAEQERQRIVGAWREHEAAVAEAVESVCRVLADTDSGRIVERDRGVWHEHRRGSWFGATYDITALDQPLDIEIDYGQGLWSLVVRLDAHEDLGDHERILLTEVTPDAIADAIARLIGPHFLPLQ